MEGQDPKAKPTLPAVLVGSTAIGRAIGASKATILRMYAANVEVLFKTGSATSPIKCLRSDLTRLRRGGFEP